MSLIAAFLWNKSPRLSISTMVIDDENMDYVIPPKIQYLTHKYFQFRSNSKKVIKNFFTQIKEIQKSYKEDCIIEYRIVFEAPHIPYITPAKESKFVYKTFLSLAKKTKKKLRKLKIQPQLRNRLSGKSLQEFKKKLRAMYLVSRRRDTTFEYHLWTVALHATSSTYKQKLQRVHHTLLENMWNEQR